MCCNRKSPSGVCAKFRTVAASSNRVHMPWSVYYYLFALHIYIFVLCAHPVRGESHIQRNATGKVATTSPPIYKEPHRSHILFVKASHGPTSTSWSQHHFVAIGKSRAAYAQSFTLLKQATIGFTCNDHSIIACSRHAYILSFFAHIPFMVNHTFNATPPERLQQMKKKRAFFVVKRMHFSKFLDFICTWSLPLKNLLDCGWTWIEFKKIMTGSGTQNMTVRQRWADCDILPSRSCLRFLKLSPSPTTVQNFFQLQSPNPIKITNNWKMQPFHQKNAAFLFH